MQLSKFALIYIFGKCSCWNTDTPLFCGEETLTYWKPFFSAQLVAYRLLHILRFDGGFQVSLTAS